MPNRRAPLPDGDVGSWGNILNDYLRQTFDVGAGNTAANFTGGINTWTSSTRPTQIWAYTRTGGAGNETVGADHTGLTGINTTTGQIERWTGTAWSILTYPNLVSTSGNIGVGLTSPAAKLHLDGGNATATSLKLTNGTTTGQTTTDGLEIGIDTAGQGEIRQRENLDLTIFTNNSARVTVKNSGNVGIGTTSPNSLLDIGQSGSNATSNTTQSSSGILSLTGSYWTGSAETKNRFTLQNIASATTNNLGTLGFLWNSTELLTMASNGIVRIAGNTTSTSTTTGALVVGGGVGIAENLNVGNNLTLTTNNRKLQFTDGSGTFPHFISQTDNNFLFYGTDATGNARPIWGNVQRSSTSSFIFGSSVPVSITNTTTSTSSTTGALTVAGGAGISENLNVGGNSLNLTNTTSNLLLFANTPTFNAPTFTTRSVGTKIVLWGGVSATDVDYAIGIQTDHLWFSTPTSTANRGFKWYGGTTNIATLDGTGSLTLANKIIAPSLQITTGAASGRVLTSDASGNATWAASSGGVTSFNTRTGAVTLTSSDITTALTYTPVNKAGDSLTGSLVMAAGTTTLAPLRLQSGTNLTTATFGAMEFDGTNLYLTNNSTTPARKTIAYTDGNITGNASTATTLQTARTIAVSGGATGTATSFNGSVNISIPITDLNATNLTSGTVADTRLSSNVVLLTGAQTISGAKTFSAITNISNTTTSTSSTTGALTVAGGVGIAENLNVGGGDITLTATSNLLTFVNGSGGAPTFTTRSIGTKILFWNGLSASASDYAMGIHTNALWFSVPTNTTGLSFKWYGGTTNIATLDGTGNFTVSAKVTAATLQITTGAASGRVLTSDASGNASWAASSTGATALSGLSDVAITTIASGQFLRYNGTNWVNSTDGSTLASLNATNLTTGTVADARLSSNVGLLTGTQTFTGAKTFSAVTNISNTTTSTSSTTGALTVGGGVGVAGALNIGGNVTFTATGGKMNFIDSGGSYQYFTSQPDSNFVFYGTTSTGDVRPVWSHIQRSDTSSFRFEPTVPVNIRNTTTSSSSTTGALTISGGVGILDNLNIGGGSLVMSNTTSNLLSFTNNGGLLPTVGTRSIGTKILLWNNLTATTSDYAIGISDNIQWYSVPANTTAVSFKWYGAATNIATLDGTGNFTVSAKVTAATLQITTGAAAGRVLTSDASGNATWAVSSSASPAGSNTQIQFNNNGAFGASTNLVWDNVNGRLGIGDSTPAAKLTIAGGNIALDNTNTITAKDTAGTYRTALIGRWSNDAVYLDGGTGGSYLRTNNGTVVNMYLATTGNVGIGTIAPNSALDIGQVSASNATSTATQSSSDIISLTGSYWNGTAETKHRFNFQNVASTTVNNTGRLAVKWNSSEFLTILSGGNVGIGTTTPDAKLSVVSGTEIAGTAFSTVMRVSAGTIAAAAGSELNTASFGGLTGGNTAGLTVSLYKNTATADWQNTALLLNYDVDNVKRSGGYISMYNGNIGIGIAAPTQKLDVNGNVNVTGDTTISGGSLSLSNATSNMLSFAGAGVAAPAFTTRSTGTKLILLPSISASAVDYALGIEGGTLWSSVPTTAQSFKWYGGTTMAATLTGAGIFSLAGRINTISGVSPTNGAIRISASSALHLNSGVNAGVYLNWDHGSGNTSTTTAFAVGNGSSTSLLTLNYAGYLYTTGTLRLGGGGGVVSDGNAAAVAWNAVEPGQGTMEFIDYCGTGGAFAFTFFRVPGTAVPTVSHKIASINQAGTYAVLSDARIKKNIQPLQYGLAEILQLQPKLYNHHYNNTFQGGTVVSDEKFMSKLGLIAQEVYTVIPEIVFRPADETREFYNLDYTSLIPVLIKAIQEQQLQIDTLQDQTQALTQSNQELRIQIESLESSQPTTVQAQSLEYESIDIIQVEIEELKKKNKAKDDENNNFKLEIQNLQYELTQIKDYLSYITTNSATTSSASASNNANSNNNSNTNNANSTSTDKK